MEKESVGRQKATRNPDGEAVEREKKKAEFYLFIYIAGDDASAKDSSQYL